MGAPPPFAIDTTHLLRGRSAVEELSMHNEARKITFTYHHNLFFRGPSPLFLYHDLPLIRILLFAKYYCNPYPRRTTRGIEKTKPNVIRATCESAANIVIMKDVVSQILVWISDNMSWVIPS